MLQNNFIEIYGKSSFRMRYGSEQLHLLNLYTLHRDFEFLHTFSAVKNPDHEPLTIYIFRRKDGKRIIYFPPARDAFDQNNIYLWHIDDVLDAYVLLRQNGTISETDITIIPLCQVVNRSHYNTVVIQKHVAHIVEPRSNNITFPFMSTRDEGPKALITAYPIKKTVGSKLIEIMKRFHSKFDVYNIWVDAQGLLDDTTCGGHQLNFTEVLARCNTIFNPEELFIQLRHCQLQRRNLDKFKLQALLTYRDFQLCNSIARPFAIQPSGEHDFNLLYKTTVASNPNENTNQEIFHKFIRNYNGALLDFLSKRQDDPTFDNVPSNMLTSINSGANQAQLDIYQNSDILVRYIINLINEGYLENRYPPSFFQSGLTRKQTALWLINLLNKLNQINHANKIPTIILILCAYYNAILDDKSRMLGTLKNGLEIFFTDTELYYIKNHRGQTSELFFTPIGQQLIPQEFIAKVDADTIFSLFRFLTSHETEDSKSQSAQDIRHQIEKYIFNIDLRTVLQNSANSSPKIHQSL